MVCPPHLFWRFLTVNSMDRKPLNTSNLAKFPAPSEPRPSPFPVFTAVGFVLSDRSGRSYFTGVSTTCYKVEQNECQFRNQEEGFQFQLCDLLCHTSASSSEKMESLTGSPPLWPWYWKVREFVFLPSWNDPLISLFLPASILERTDKLRLHSVYWML